MNSVNITGRITHDLELKVTNTNKHILDFQVAIREGKDDTTFVRCRAWEKTADILSQYASKGSNLAITGSLKTDRYQNKEGKNVEKQYVLVNRVEILDHRKEKLTDWQSDNEQFTESLQGTEYANQFGGDRYDSANNVIDKDDLPFY